MKFIKWWWVSKLGETDRLVLTLILLLGSTIAGGIIIHSVGVFLSGFGITLLYLIGMYFLTCWREYQKMRNEQAREIVNRLSGHVNPNHTLERLRKSVKK